MEKQESESIDAGRGAECLICGSFVRRPVAVHFLYTARPAGRWTAIYRCGRCGVYFRSPPSALELKMHFENVAYSDVTNWRAYIVERLPFFRLCANELIRYLKSYARGESHGKLRLLDVGCGFGEFGVVLRDCGFEVSGVEPIAHVRELARGRGFSVWSSVHEAAGPFDVISFIDIFYYLTNPVDTLVRCAKLLRENGCLFMRLTNRNMWVRSYLFFTGLRRLRFRGLPVIPNWLIGDAIVSYSPLAVKRMLASCGFSNVTVRPERPSDFRG
ncbi:MAG: class I SAM-dependent methyltransferase, partial [Bacillota bacterium]